MDAKFRVISVTIQMVIYQIWMVLPWIYVLIQYNVSLSMKIKVFSVSSGVSFAFFINQGECGADRPQVLKDMGNFIKFMLGGHEMLKSYIYLNKVYNDIVTYNYLVESFAILMLMDWVANINKLGLFCMEGIFFYFVCFLVLGI